MICFDLIIFDNPTTLKESLIKQKNFRIEYFPTQEGALMYFHVASLIVCLSIMQACAMAQTGAILFTSVKAPQNLSVRDDPTVMRIRYVKVNVSRIRDDSAARDKAKKGVLSLNLFDDAVYLAIPDSIEASSSGGLTWVGHLEGIDNSQVSLVIEGNVMAGNITMPGHIYHIRFVGEGIHAIYQIDQSAFPQDEPFVPTVTP
jgi:hypothetical protein